MRKLSILIPLLTLFLLSGGNATAQNRDSDKVEITIGDLRRNLEREDRLRAAFSATQKKYIECDSTQINLKKQIKKKTRGKRFWQGVGIVSIVYAIVKTI